MAGEPLTNVGKTLGGMKTRLRVELGGRTDLTDELLTEWINDSYLDIATSLRLPSLNRSTGFNTIAGEESYILPGDMGVIKTVAWYELDGTRGGKVAKGDIDAYRKLPPQTGEPQLYAREGDILVLWPTPSDVFGLSLDFKAKVRKLVLDTDSPIIDEEFHEAIYLGSKARGMDAAQNYLAADRFENAQLKSIRKKLDKEAEEDENKVGQLRPVRKASQLGAIRPAIRSNPNAEY
jgi:hypothetical protein